MSIAQAGELFGIKAPDVGETTRIPVVLLDTDGNTVTGQAWNAAGMTVALAKYGASSFSAFPSFATGNWDEIGYGNYDIILSGDQADEAGLLDTEGPLRIYVKTTATRGDTFIYKVNVRDVLRQTELQQRVSAAQ